MEKAASINTQINSWSSVLPDSTQGAIRRTLGEWRRERHLENSHQQGSPTPFSGRATWLVRHQAEVARLRDFAEDIQRARFSQILLLGTGEGSWGARVFRQAFAFHKAHAEFKILDSADPVEIRRQEESLELDRTLFIISSKSRNGLDPKFLYRYFRARIESQVGPVEAAHRFVAITDTGSELAKLARDEKFREVFSSDALLGGRSSALSISGLLPAALLGVDIERFLLNSQVMAQACDETVLPEMNPAIQLGLILGTLALQGRDKLTFTSSASLDALAHGLENIIAESTDKRSRGLIPVLDEPLASPHLYGTDRVFVHLEFAGLPRSESESINLEKLFRLEKAGHPVVKIRIDDMYRIGQEFIRWEMGLAIAGAILEVDSSRSSEVLKSAQAGSFTDLPTIFYEGDGSRRIELHADERNAAEIALNVDRTSRPHVAGNVSLGALLQAHIDRLGKGDYLAILAYLPKSAESEKYFTRLRVSVRDRKQVATCFGYGPSYLHVAGQLHQAGPNSGVFLVFTSEESVASGLDLDIPNERISFGAVELAQANADLEELAQQRKRVLRIHLGSDVNACLEQVGKALGVLLLEDYAA